MKPGLKFLNSIFEVTHLEFQTYDITHHKLTFSSGLACRLLGYSEEEYEQLSVGFYKTIIHPDDVQTVQDTLQKISKANKGEVFEMTIRLLKSDGAYIWVYSRQMVYEHRGQVTTIIREVEDVTRLIELKNELEQKVDQLKTVSYKNSHLLRGPVASILGLVDMVEDEGINGEHNRQIFRYLKETITKLDNVVYEINDDARVDGEVSAN